MDVSRFREVLKFQASSPELTIGIRPEHIEVSKERVSPYIEGTVMMVEPLGSKTVIHANINTILIQMLCPPSFRVEYKSKVWIKFNLDHVHIFDRKSGKSII